MSVVCAGEVLLDCWPDGSQYPGGAPANVAFHLAQAGLDVSLVSRVGADEAGNGLQEWLRSTGGGLVLQTDALHATGRVEVRPNGSGNLYDISSPAAWDFLEADSCALDAVRCSRVLVFGTLAQRYPVARQAIRRLAETAKDSGAVRLADLNLRAPFYDSETILWTVRHADVLKLNVDELRTVSEMLGARGSSEELFLGLVREFGLERAVLTGGSDGAWVFERGEMEHVAADATEAVDTVGAGDAFTAMLAKGLVRGWSMHDAAQRASKLAAWVVSARGATPAWSPAMRRSLGD